MHCRTMYIVFKSICILDPFNIEFPWSKWTFFFLQFLAINTFCLLYNNNLFLGGFVPQKFPIIQKPGYCELACPRKYYPFAPDPEISRQTGARSIASNVFKHLWIKAKHQDHLILAQPQECMSSLLEKNCNSTRKPRLTEPNHKALPTRSNTSKLCNCGAWGLHWQHQSQSYN